MPPSSLKSADLLHRLLEWYDRNRRDLPWRAPPSHRANTYHVLVSEFMLQQTTVATVRARFPDFVARFPSLESLAAASREEVLHAWQGLGYYRRAHALHACAAAIVARHGGGIPDDERVLQALPGVGPYTAYAIAAIAFDRPVLPVDGNVLRVLARLIAIDEPLERAERRLRGLAAELVPHTRAGDVAQALMDLGALVCTPARPRCLLCPLNSACLAYRSGSATSIPRRPERTLRPHRSALAFLLRRPDGAILFRKRPDQGLLGGLHELPLSHMQEGELVVDAALVHAPQALAWRLHEHRVRHVFTHFALELALAEATTEDPPAGLWCAPGQFHELALSSLVRKLLRLAGYATPAPGEAAGRVGRTPAQVVRRT